MSAQNPTHYDVLGLSQTATQAEIKKRYRELARHHHPDVAKAADAATRFREINEANRILSDPARREHYDAELKLKARGQAEATHDGRRQPSNNSQRPPNPSHPNTQPPKRPNAQPPKHPNTQTPEHPTTHLLDEARKALARHRYRDAEGLCRRVLQIDRRNSAAYEVLGDTYIKRNRSDEALAMYSYAIQLDRGNRSAQVKLDKMTGRPSGATMAGTAARASRPAAVPSDPASPPRTHAGITLVASGLILFMLYVIWSTRQPPAHSPWIFEWDSLLVLALAVSGLAAGFMAAFNGWIERAANVLSARRRGQPGGSSVPLGAVLGGFSLILFHGSALLYLLLGSLQGLLVRSVLAAYGITYALVALFALASHVAAPYVLLFGGNVVFVTFLSGWLLADRMRE